MTAQEAAAAPASECQTACSEPAKEDETARVRLLAERAGKTEAGEPRIVVLFDGLCRFCWGFVAVLLRRDSGDRFRFTALQSPLGQELLGLSGLPSNLDSVVLLRGPEVLIKSDAALSAMGEMDGVLSALAVLKIVPRGLRDWGYETFARWRYTIFGEQEDLALDGEFQRKILDPWAPDPNAPAHVCGS